MNMRHRSCVVLFWVLPLCDNLPDRASVTQSRRSALAPELAPHLCRLCLQGSEGRWAVGTTGVCLVPSQPRSWRSTCVRNREAVLPASALHPWAPSPSWHR